MLITYLGHAGFCIETDEVVLVLDPWLSPGGAFDSAWFQYPCNHHLAPFVAGKLSDPTRQRFVYVSHEHKDHFDPAFLQSLPVHDFTIVAPGFRQTRLIDELSQIGDVVPCADGDRLEIPGGWLQLSVDDSIVDRDSAILVELGGLRFLDLNDCKLFERLSDLRRDVGEIHAFSCQFSGATWHPTCYDYPADEYAAISAKKARDKFETVARAIETLEPEWFLPAAGPACFLDPTLAHLNTEPVNIFPRSAAFLDFLAHRLPAATTRAPELVPGDRLDVATGEIELVPDRVDDGDFEAIVTKYAGRHADRFVELERSSRRDPEEVLEALASTMRERVRRFRVGDRIGAALYVALEELPDRWLRVDFGAETVDERNAVEDEPYTSLLAPSWQIDRLLDGRITWEDFALTFRLRLRRRPDVYEPLLHAFLLGQTEDLPSLRRSLLRDAASRGGERTIVEAGNCRYAVDRWCPHLGGDLRSGWIEDDSLLTCSRHRWQFDLAAGGKCTTADATIHAERLEEPAGIASREATYDRGS